MVQFITIAPVTVNELQARLRSFCENHPIEKLEVFGSVAQASANKESDIDLLATFFPDIPTGFAYYTFVRQLEDELADILGAKVDLLNRESVERARNPILRNEILSRAKVIYERFA